MFQVFDIKFAPMCHIKKKELQINKVKFKSSIEVHEIRFIKESFYSTRSLIVLSNRLQHEREKFSSF